MKCGVMFWIGDGAYEGSCVGGTSWQREENGGLFLRAVRLLI